MSSHHNWGNVMTDADQFHIRICGCGVVHLSFGCNVVNLSAEATLAVAETLKDATLELERRTTQGTPTPPPVSVAASQENVIQGRFPKSV